ncbi:MAG: hypothetical protein RBS68_09645 [Anaerolineales bacterium]|jgi:hypothetical protein|nr:hypothetical protein [Anaerolineales bacterium]
MTFKSIQILLVLALGLTACAQQKNSSDRLAANTATGPLSTPREAATPLPPTPTQTLTSTATATPTTTATPDPTATPTYAILRGTANVEKVSCRYGPGAMYLYLYGMNQGANQDVIGRNQQGTWALTKARGDDKSCWVRSDLLSLSGDILSVAPIDPQDYKLPKSPFYGPLTNVNARRSGDTVIVSWSPLGLRAGDDSLQTPYVLQVWVCRAGKIVMESLGAYETTASVIDESGCSETSRGRISAAEKHGYTKFVEISWP